MARILRIVAAAFGTVLYVWFAAVRNLPRVRRRKARRKLAKPPVA